jgi:TfoX/Sxy family transcriptional regulator of competence genes
MAYDENLAKRVQPLLSRKQGFSAKKMFGGMGFLLNGHMCVGIWKDKLIARVGPENYKQALEEPTAREFDITGRAMTGWVMIEPDGLAKESELKHWVGIAAKFAGSLPPKIK